MEQNVYVFRPKIPQSWCVPWNAFFDAIRAGACHALGPETLAAFTNAEAETIGTTKVMVMTGAARDISVARQDLVIEQKLTDFRFFRIKSDEIIVRQRPWKIGRKGGQSDAEGKDMKQAIHGFILAVAGALASPVLAEIETARDLMEAGRFEEAMQEFLPAARSGNADAEELIGVMYALGLGVERDPERAFEWYLRSSLKGHPGAQSGLGWYYELGLGMPAPDLVRAYLWYGLSTIGGDPDAAISLEEIQKKMTQDEIDRAEVLINDYKPWMYPFR